MKTHSKVLRAALIGFSLLTAVNLSACAAKQQQETVGQYVDASVTTATIKNRILVDKHLSNTTITVKTYQYTVQLSGFVHNAKQKMRAEMLARQVEGVTNVDNALIIKK